MSDRAVTRLPSTEGIKDPQIREFLESLASAWNTRSGDVSARGATNVDRFITRGEIDGLVENGILTSFGVKTGSNVVGGPPHSNETPLVGSTRERLINLTDRLRASPLWALLGTSFELQTLNKGLSDASLLSLKQGINEINNVTETSTSFSARRLASVYGRMGVAEAGIVDIQNVNLNAGTTFAQDLNAVFARVGSDRLAITGTIQTAQVNMDTVVASVFNQVYALLGGTSSSITSLAQATSTNWAGTAARWNQVQAVVQGANGQILSSGVLQETVSNVNVLTNKANASWSVRVQIDTGKGPMVSGFGLYGDNISGSAFIVRADSFLIDSPDNPVDGIAPFAVVTTGPDTDRGVFINAAVIQRASIGDVHIADGTISGGKLRDGSLESIKFASSIQSDNYVGGSTGWKIDRSSGEAYFKAVHIRDVVRSSVFVPNNSGGVVVPHNLGRPVIVTVWASVPNVAIVHDVTSSDFTVGYGGDGSSSSGTMVYYTLM